ncbi:hypothetical protein OSTOST_14804, partial [Ostertagia ostertagi]
CTAHSTLIGDPQHPSVVYSRGAYLGISQKELLEETQGAEYLMVKPSFSKPGLQRQYEFNSSILAIVEPIAQVAPPELNVKADLLKAVKAIKQRNELLTIADKDPAIWEVYDQHSKADSYDSEFPIIATCLRERKKEQKKDSSKGKLKWGRPHPYSRQQPFRAGGATWALAPPMDSYPSFSQQSFKKWRRSVPIRKLLPSTKIRQTDVLRCGKFGPSPLRVQREAKVTLYLDDGLIWADSAHRCEEFVRTIRKDLELAGVTMAEDKCSWIPLQRITWLGHIIDLVSFTVNITHERREKAKNFTINLLKNKGPSLLQRMKWLGYIASMYLVIPSDIQKKWRSVMTQVAEKQSIFTSLKFRWKLSIEETDSPAKQPAVSTRSHRNPPLSGRTLSVVRQFRRRDNWIRVLFQAKRGNQHVINVSISATSRRLHRFRQMEYSIFICIRGFDT